MWRVNRSPTHNRDLSHTPAGATGGRQPARIKAKPEDKNLRLIAPASRPKRYEQDSPASISSRGMHTGVNWYRASEH
jgi:hypothetical protein